MPICRAEVSFWFLLSASVLPLACASFPYPSDYPLSSEYYTSRDGFLHYRVPSSWFDATRDSQDSSDFIWLVRKDYAATISVREVKVDATARQQISHEDLEKLAYLTMSLTANDKFTIQLRSPKTFTIGSTAFCGYELVNVPSMDTLRVVLVDTGTKAYEVTALVAAGNERVSALEVFSVQQAFLGSLRW